MGLLRQCVEQLIFEVRGSYIEAFLSFPVLGTIISMTGDINQMSHGAYPVFVEGLSAPARWTLKQHGIDVLWYNNDGVIWVRPEDGELADSLLEMY